MSVPQTYNRAATALVRARRHLEQACSEVQLAFGILAARDDRAALWPGDEGERQALLGSLTAFLERLEQTRAAASRTLGSR